MDVVAVEFLTVLEGGSAGGDVVGDLGQQILGERLAKFAARVPFAKLGQQCSEKTGPCVI
jgi:hypothetical protein